MSILDLWAKKADKQMKINPNKQLKEKLINGRLQKNNNLIIDITTVDDMKSGILNELITYSNLNSGIFCSKKINNTPQSSYTEDCPLFLAYQNREQFIPDVYDYIKKELGVEEKMTDTDFYKTYQKFFLIETRAILIKVLYITADVALGNDILKKEILKLTPGLYKKFKEMMEVNIDLFESGEIINKCVKLTTNGQSGGDIRYKSMIVDHEPNDTTLKLIPDWSKDNDFQDFDLISLKPTWTKEDILKECGEIKMYQSFEELVEDINKMIPYLRGGKLDDGNSIQKVTESKPSSVKPKGKNVLSAFNIVDKEEVAKTIKDEVIQSTPVENKESSKLDNLVAEIETIADSNTDKKSEEVVEETNNEGVFLKYEETKSFKRKEWLKCFGKIKDEKDNLDITEETINLILEALEDNTQVKSAKDALLKDMEEKDLLYF
jgi:hypothetical protein